MHSDLLRQSARSPLRELREAAGITQKGSGEHFRFERDQNLTCRESSRGA